MLTIYSKILNVIRRLKFGKYFGFVVGHSYLNKNKFCEMNGIMLANSSSDLIQKYETSFANLVATTPGSSFCVSYAAGRMAFYSILKMLNIGENDEVILQGHTCSVMPNAVLRTGATPIFADIDPDTFGSSANEIDKVISEKTKLIVAQHSFGIPCRIHEIVKLASKNNIFLIEDCALTLGSTIGGIQVGNFGDAAIFSTDHSKPINTIIGGIMYTRNEDMYKRLKQDQSTLPGLPMNRKEALFNRAKFETKYFNPRNYGKSQIMEILNKLLKRQLNPYLTEDYSASVSKSYPYPATLPSFLAILGLSEIKRWESEKNIRQQQLHLYLRQSQLIGLTQFLPKRYFDSSVDIIPLRFVYTHPTAENVIAKMSKIIDTKWFWFQKPIIACNDPRELGYKYGSCPISEQVGKDIINWPCIINNSDNKKILKYFRKAHN